MDSEVSLLISRFLSYTVVGICIFMKLPQVLSIFLSGDTKGVNLMTYMLEVSSYLIGFFYGYAHNYHVTIYLESGFLAIQSGIIIILIVYYKRQWTAANGLYAIFTGSFIALSLLDLIPRSLFRILLMCALPISVVSKLMQIKTLYRIKARGTVSVLTWSLSAYGCFARVFTVYVEVADLQILFNFLSSGILNVVVVTMCFYYGNAAKDK